MALTAGFKKFLGLIVVVAVVGGGIAYYKHMPRHVDEAVTTPVDTTASEASPPPVASTPEPSVRPDQTETQEAPAQPATKPDASANRGLSAVLNAGKK